jgi:hypothetical protein
VGALGNNMNGHRKLVSILGRSQIYNTCEPSSREKAIEIGADFVRQIFCDFKFDFRISGGHLNDANQRLC